MLKLYLQLFINLMSRDLFNSHLANKELKWKEFFKPN